MNPELRFKDQNGNDFPDWEEKKIGNELLIQRGGSPRPIENFITNKEGYNWIKIGDAPINGNRIIDVKEKIIKEGAKFSRAVYKGDLILSNSMSFGRPYILEVDGYIHDGWLLLRDENKKFDLFFLCEILGSSLVYRQYKKLAAGSTVNNLNKDLVSGVFVDIPSKEEQSKIATLLSNIDKKIEAQAIVVEKLKNTKYAMFVKMFPQGDSINPKLRFKKENGEDYCDWGKEKLNKIASPKARIGWQGMRQSEFLDFGEYYLITGTDFNNGSINFDSCCYVEKYRYDQDKNIQVHNGDILITKDGTLGKVAYISNMDKPATLNAGVFVLKNLDEKMDALFLYHYLAAPFLMEYANEQATGGTIKHLNKKVLVSFEIPIPEKEEQIKIGKCLSNLDKEIEINQQKYDKLCDVKKALLSKLFPTKEDE